MSPATLKPFAILVLYFMMYQFSGVNTITFYAVEIISQTGIQANKYALTIILGVFRLVFTVIACIAMRKCGRRPLTFISGNYTNKLVDIVLIRGFSICTFIQHFSIRL